MVFKRFTVRVCAIAALVALVPTLGGCAPESVNLSGHGWGHGRGMSQWGSLGYAVDKGWSSGQILHRYFGGTTVSTITPVQESVFLTASKGKELIVTQGAKSLLVDGGTSTYAAVRVIRLSAGKFRVMTGPGCGGPWTTLTERNTAWVGTASSLPQGDDSSRMLQLCGTSGNTLYRGALRVMDVNASAVTVNHLATEEMLRSVVAKEVSPSWADAGSGKGAQAVRAQAIAARSYVRAGDTRWGTWATTCDSSASCLAYPGFGSIKSGSTTVVKVEDARVISAVSATANQVLKFSSGKVARTEFSSSSGGWTAGGTFPAVQDDGDAYSGNSNHSWSLTLQRSLIESKFDTREGKDMGEFKGFDSFTRNGKGDWGGRVLQLRANFTKGSVTLTGEQFRSLFGLKSNWFTIS